MPDQEQQEGGLVSEAHDVMALVERIKPLFGGVQPEVIGAVLADLTAMYLAGHVSQNPRMTKEVREAALKIHLKAIRALIPLNEAMIRERMAGARDEAKDRPN